MMKGLKKAKCEWWRKCAEDGCSYTDEEAENCSAKTKEGYCLSLIIDTEMPSDPNLYYHL